MHKEAAVALLVYRVLDRLVFDWCKKGNAEGPAACLPAQGPGPYPVTQLASRAARSCRCGGEQPFAMQKHRRAVCREHRLGALDGQCHRSVGASGAEGARHRHPAGLYRTARSAIGHIGAGASRLRGAAGERLRVVSIEAFPRCEDQESRLERAAIEPIEPIMLEPPEAILAMPPSRAPSSSGTAHRGLSSSRSCSR